MTTRLRWVLVSTAISLALGACSSDKKAGAGGGTALPKTGVFVDHPVWGLEYETPTHNPALTDRQGTFGYLEGESVRFFIGNVELGTIPGAGVVTLLSLTGAQSMQDPAAVNIARLLQTLDADCDTSNGILISPATRAAGDSADELDFEQSETDFGSDPDVLAFVQTAGGACPGLIAANVARAEAEETLVHMADNNGQPNRLPTAVAGTDRAVGEGVDVTLSGDGTDDDGEITGYAWTQIAGPAVQLTGAAGQTPAFTAPSVAGDTLLRFRLRVTDNDGATADDDVAVTVNAADNVAPTADAGANQTVAGGALVTLDGSGSSDPEDQALTYAWRQVGAATVTLANAGTAQASFTAPAVTEATVLQFTLRVTDVEGAISEDTVDVTISGTTPANQAPTADAGPAQTVLEGSAVTLDGRASTDPEDGSNLTYAWQQTSGTPVQLAGANASQAVFTAPQVDEQTSLVFELRVTDTGGLSSTDTVVITVNNLQAANQPPNAVASATPSTVNEGGSVTLDGAQSSDPEDGAVTTYAWSQTGGPSVSIGNANGAQATFTAPDVAAATELTFRLTVTDSQNLEDTADVIVTVNDVPPGNVPPVADAGADTQVEDSATDPVQLNGGGSTDADGTIPANGYAWTQVVAQGDPVVTLTGADTKTPSFTAPDVAGDRVLTFQLVVTDDDGAQSDSDQVNVTVVDTMTASIAGAAGVDEGNAGATPLNFTVTLSQPAPAGGVSMSYGFVDVTTVNGSDYAGVNGTLTFAEGETSRAVPSQVNGDTFDENDETFRVILSGLDDIGSGNTTAVGTIRDDDTTLVGGSPLLRAGAAKRSVVPTQAHIDGIDERRVFDPDAIEAGVPGPTHKQKFNLGGFGINPMQNFADPFGALGEQLTTPAGARVFSGSRGEERTFIRAMVLEQSTGTRVAFVTLDAVGAGNVIQAGVKQAIVNQAALLGAPIAAENILFGQTHTHAGADLQGLWGGVPADWIKTILYPAAGEAIKEALEQLRPARLTMRQGNTSEFNNYRRPRLDPNADADSTMTLLRARGDDGTPVGSILQYNAHPTAIGDGADPRYPHPDYPLGAEDWLESIDTGEGGTSLYYNGPIADASGSSSRSGCAFPENNRPGADFGTVRCRGEGMALAAQGFAERELVPTIEPRVVEVILPITNPAFVAGATLGAFNRYYDFNQMPASDIPEIGPLVQAQIINLPQITPTARTHVSRVTIGGAADGLEVVTIPGETTNTFGQYIRGLAATNVMLLGLTHNSFGYILPEEEFHYFDASGNDGFVAPYTGYEENVSMGPLTAPLLRIQGYNMLFDRAPEEAIPANIRACADLMSEDCILNDVGRDLEYIQSNIARSCRESGPAEFCQLFDPNTPFDQLCREGGFRDAFCDTFGDGTPAEPNPDQDLAAAALEAQLRGCDILDPAHCLFPFPSDQFTVDAAADSPQSVAKGGTGRRVEMNLLATPRNTAGKPVDPTEWNRNDGFSPGQMIVTYVPGLAANADGTIPGAPPITDVAQSLNLANSSVLVLDAATGQPHPVWAEIDLNANLLLIPAAPEAGELGENVERPAQDGRAALIIRPAKNFLEGHRYVVVLKNLKDSANQALPAQTAFTTCRDELTANLPPVQARCAQLASKVFPTVKAALGVTTLKNREDLYLAWDFTVASAKNNVGRLAHMRDDAFNSLALLPGTDCTAHADGTACRAPAFTVEKVTPNPQSGIARRIEGSITVPSYVVPTEPTPLDDPQVSAALRSICENIPADAPQEFRDGCESFLEAGSLGQGATLPPNRLFYNPADGLNPNDPLGSRYGDGLPDRAGGVAEMTTRFICQVPERALTEGPARAGIYGHGLLDSRVAITYDGVPDLSREYNFMFCAVDLFGFSTGDLGNVASTLVDVSNFPVVPDGSQQGLLNYMFLARLLVHPQGFASDPAFQANGAPLFDRREVFYDGNSQGGIVGGPVLAISKDVNRGVLGSLGMNYSTLLQRSKDFDPYSTPLYVSYTDPLDRMFLFSMMQMLWDRSENNGYGEHLTTKSSVEGGPVDAVLLHPMFGDQQVTMWSADVMARTMGIPVDYRMVGRAGKTYPDGDPGFPLPDVVYTAEGGFSFSSAMSALVNWADTRTDNNVPIGNVPHRAGRDPHDDSAKKQVGRCQKAHFLHRNGRLLDVNTSYFAPEEPDSAFTPAQCPAQQDNSGAPGIGELLTPLAEYGSGLLGALGQLFAEMNQVTTALLSGDPEGSAAAFQSAMANFADNMALLPASANDAGALVGLHSDPQSSAMQAAGANRDAEAVVLTGAQVPAWSAPAAAGQGYPYPSGVGGDGEALSEGLDDGLGTNFHVRNAHNGEMIYPVAGQALPLGVPVNEIAAYAFRNGQWVEIPVQVDERMPYFLANANSGFSFYSGTDPEISYVWDTESWGMTQGVCRKAYDTNGIDDGRNEGLPGPTPDPVAGLDNDDEIVFMASDAGDFAGDPTARPDGLAGAEGQQIALVDPLDASAQRYVYLFRKAGGSSFRQRPNDWYVKYQRDADADQWIDRSFFADSDPQKLGTSNTGYGPNLQGTVCDNGITPRPNYVSGDRFPRDGVVVTTSKYRWQASGRWMVRDIKIARPGQPGVYGPDLLDRWKGRAFQQSPDSNISVVGFEDEQVNWEANSGLLGERVGPVRAIRETWGADSGTNVTKTETFYRDAVSYRYHVRVHPIPPDGLYTAWDYNRGAMVSDNASVPGGRYFTALRPQGVPIDGVNDEIGNVDGFSPVPGLGCPSPDDSGFIEPNAFGRCPAFFDAADLTFNVPLAFDNWEQVSGKGDSGSLVYTFEMTGATSVGNPLVVPYYRDDACLDDGTGDDPIQRPYPGERADDARVLKGYVAANGGNPDGDYAAQYAQLRCDQKQGAYAAHGIHYFFTHDTDNAFTPTTSTEVDGRQWQFMVPTASPTNVAEPYANVVRAPLLPAVTPLPGF